MLTLIVVVLSVIAVVGLIADLRKFSQNFPIHDTFNSLWFERLR